MPRLKGKKSAVSERSAASQAGLIFAPKYLCALVSSSACMCMMFASVFHDGSDNVLPESWTSRAPQTVSRDVSRLGKVLSSELSLSAIFHFNGRSARASFTDLDTGPSVSY